MFLQGKKILFFCPDFFDYYKSIENELKVRGAKVFTILENYCNHSLFYRMFFIKNQKTRYWYTKNQINAAIDNITEDIDVVFVVRGEAISPTIMKKLKMKFTSARFLMYQWDCIAINPNVLAISSYFDKVYTFDRLDAENNGWIYRPLFYSNGSYTIYEKRKYDLSLVGTLYYKRAKLHKNLVELTKRNGWTFFSYLYSLKYIFYIHKFIMRDQRYRDVDVQDVKFISLNRNDLAEVYRNSRVVVDYAGDDQSGLTIRTIESIGHRCKLITNNKMILKEKFYKKENIYVYDFAHISIPKGFLESPYEEIDSSILDYLSLSGWINTIFEVENNLF